MFTIKVAEIMTPAPHEQVKETTLQLPLGYVFTKFLPSDKGDAYPIEATYHVDEDQQCYEEKVRVVRVGIDIREVFGQEPWIHCDGYRENSGEILNIYRRLSMGERLQQEQQKAAMLAMAMRQQSDSPSEGGLILPFPNRPQ